MMLQLNMETQFWAIKNSIIFLHFVTNFLIILVFPGGLQFVYAFAPAI